MNKFNRRDFIKSSVAGAGAFIYGSHWVRAESAPGKSTAADAVPLGKTGVTVSRLAQGTGVHGGARQSDHTRMGQKAFDEIIHHGFDQGVRFFDMADLYGTHPFFRNALKGISRDKYILLSKIWTRKENWNTPSGGAKEEVDRFSKELGTDTLDICLVHCMINSQWTDSEKRVRDELSELKSKGRIRAVGVSCHDHGALKTAASDPWTEVIFARINHMGGSKYKMDGTAEEISATLKTARANGKAVVGMKIFGEGTLIEPDQKDASLKFVFGNQLVDAVTIGMRKTSEVDDTIERMNKALRA